MSTRNSHVGVWRRAFYAIVLGVVIVALAAAPVLAVDGSGSSQELYDRIVSRAAAGDPAAKAAKSAIDRYMEAKGLSAAAMPNPEQSVEMRGGDLEQLRLEGIPPWSITVRNDTRVANSGKLDAYRALRHQAVAELAEDSPGREVEVYVAPDRFRSVSQFARDLECECPIKDIRADVWVGNHWVMEVGLLDTKRKNFVNGAEEIERDLMEEATSALDLYQGVRPADLSITVRSARLTPTASEAKRMRSARNVLLVDPTTDVYDRFRGKAAMVEVANAPDVFRYYADYELGRPLVPNEIKPVLQSED